MSTSPAAGARQLLPTASWHAQARRDLSDLTFHVGACTSGLPRRAARLAVPSLGPETPSDQVPRSIAT